MSVSVLWELCAYASFQTPNRFASALPYLKYYFSFPVLLHRIHVSEIHSINMESLMENKKELNNFFFNHYLFKSRGKGKGKPNQSIRCLTAAFVRHFM